MRNYFTKLSGQRVVMKMIIKNIEIMNTFHNASSVLIYNSTF